MYLCLLLANLALELFRLFHAAKLVDGFLYLSQVGRPIILDLLCGVVQESPAVYLDLVPPPGIIINLVAVVVVIGVPVGLDCQLAVLTEDCKVEKVIFFLHHNLPLTFRQYIDIFQRGP